MKCILCRHPRAPEIHAALAAAPPYRDLARQFSLTPQEIHAHQQAHSTQSPLATPQGRATFQKSTRADQLFMTLDAACGFLDAAMAAGHVRHLLPAARLFLQCQGQIDRYIDPLVDERRHSNANLRHRLLAEREQIRKKGLEKDFEQQATLRLLTAHPDLFDEWDKHMDACRQEEAA